MIRLAQANLPPPTMSSCVCAPLTRYSRSGDVCPILQLRKTLDGADLRLGIGVYELSEHYPDDCSAVRYCL